MRRNAKQTVTKRQKLGCVPRVHAISTAVAAHLGHRSGMVACAVSLGLLLGVNTPTSAATFTVTNTNDTGPGSLRRAVNNANANPGPDEVVFSSVSGTVTLNSGRIKITDSVNINGPGADVLTVDGNNSARIFYMPYRYGVPDIDVTISGLTLTNSRVSAIDVDLCCVYGEVASVTIESCVISGNSGMGLRSNEGVYDPNELIVRDSLISGNGGAGMQLIAGKITIQDSNISNNNGSGIDIFVDKYNSSETNIKTSVISGNQESGIGFGYGGYLTIEDSVMVGNGFSGVNSASDTTIRNSTIHGNVGTGVFAYGVTIENSTISGNTGGGVDSPFAVTILNSTIAENRANTQMVLPTGGGVYAFSGATIANSTITGNSASVGGGIVSSTDYASTIVNTIIAGNTATVGDPDLSGVFNVEWSLIGDPGSATINESIAGSNVIAADPRLGALQDNGGPTQTHVLLSGSPAIDRGDPVFAPPPDTDQRGFSRVAGGRIDIGAVEVEGGGEIGDFVWEDVNGDGIQDGGEPGLEGVTVNLLDCVGNVLATGTSGADGGYRFGGLPVGSNAIRFVAPSGFVFSPPLQGMLRGFDSDADPATGDTRCLSMSQDQVRLGIDAGLVREAGGSGQIGDRIWDDLDGDGIQDPGEPGLGDITVRLLDCDGNELATTSSGANGGYLFHGLSAGQYRIGIVTPPGFALSPALQGNKRGLDSNPNPATGVTACLPMADGQSRLGIDAGLIQFAVGIAKIGDRVWEDLNADGIQDPAEPGLAGVKVNLQTCTGTLQGTTTTNSNGNYLFEDLIAGSYKVEFVAPSGFEFSPRAQGTKRGFDSDVFPATGLTVCLPMANGQVRLGIDAGLNQP